MSHRIRLLAAGLTTTLAAGTVGLGIAPAQAATAKTFGYDCTGTVTEIVPMPIAFDPITMLPTMIPFPTPHPVSTTVPLTVTLPDTPALGALTAGERVAAIPVSGSLGLGPVLTLLGASLQTVSTSLNLPLSGAAAPLSVALGTAAPVGIASILDGQLPLTGAIPAFTAPTTTGSYPISLPTTLSLPLTHVTSSFTTTDTLTCTLGAAVTAGQRVLTTLGVKVPSAAVGVGTGPGPVTTGPQQVDTSAANPCVVTPAAKAGQRASRLTARAAKVSWRKKPTIRVEVRARRKAAKGTVIACYGAMKVGQKALRRGRATLRTLRFYPGRYQVRLVYLGSPRARASAKTVTLRVRR